MTPWSAKVEHRLHIVRCTAMRHNADMKFGHAGLWRFWERGDASRLNPAHVGRIERLLETTLPMPADRRKWTCRACSCTS